MLAFPEICTVGNTEPEPGPLHGLVGHGEWPVAGQSGFGSISTIYAVAVKLPTPTALYVPLPCDEPIEELSLLQLELKVWSLDPPRWLIAVAA